MPTIQILNGPNINLLGQREPAIYGHQSLADVVERCRTVARQLGLEIDARQTNHEGELVDWLQECGHEVAAGRSLGAVLNAGAYTHTSLALRDAVVGADVPIIEVHLSNVYARENFRHHSYLSGVARGVIAGLGVAGYELAISALHRLAEEAS